MDADRERIEGARRRLRGLSVATPLIGGLTLPGFPCRPGLRVKLENLQLGGSLRFRGAMHALARRLGAPREAVAVGAFRSVLAEVCAAALQRVPVTAVLEVEVGPRERALLRAAGVAACEVCAGPEAARARAAELRRGRGAFVFPGPGDPDFDLGIATVGLELAEEISAETDLVLVGPAAFAAAVGGGLRAGGRPIPTLGVEPPPPEELAALRLAVRDGLRVDADDAGLAALAGALAGEASAPCALIGA
jgi:threonine dehydratase